MPGPKLDKKQKAGLRKALKARLANRDGEPEISIFKDIGKDFGVSAGTVRYYAKNLNGKPKKVGRPKKKASRKRAKRSQKPARKKAVKKTRKRRKNRRATRGSGRGATRASREERVLLSKAQQLRREGQRSLREHEKRARKYEKAAASIRNEGR